MKNIITITKKEFMSYFNSPIAYVVVSIFLCLTNWFFFQDFFLRNQASMRAYFTLLPWIFLLLSPAITMRSWAEEKRSGTLETLLTLPISDFEVVMAKFLSSLLFLTVFLIFSLSVPYSISNLGSLDRGQVLGGYIGALLLGGAFLALGLLISSLAKNQIVSFLISAAAGFLLFILGSDMVLQQTAEPISSLFRFLSLGGHFSSVNRGVLDSRDLLFYFSFIVFFLYLNTKSLESRQWK